MQGHIRMNTRKYTQIHTNTHISRRNNSGQGS